MEFKCSFNGIDEFTDIDRVYELSQRFPFIEWGILYSLTRSEDDREIRYPSYNFIWDLLEDSALYGEALYPALHLCGKAARDFLLEDDVPFSPLVYDVDRIQINVNLKELDIQPFFALRRLMSTYPFRSFIIQYNDNNKNIIDDPINRQFMIRFNSIHILKDASCGNGILTEDTSIPDSCSFSPIGFAGGLDPENISTAFPRIYNSVIAANVEGANDNKMFWIDMESGVRTNDKFDLDKVEAVASYVDSYIKSAPTELIF
ncbi:MAG: hypothetical protein JWP44_5016 [Mucilaginibacter sp.]|nr:hypothetical protein [Mucilaginibacter sp.]